jgi:hypothetical protein
LKRLDVTGPAGFRGIDEPFFPPKKILADDHPPE